MDWYSTNTADADLRFGYEVIQVRKVVKGFKGEDEWTECGESVIADPGTVKGNEQCE